MSKSAVLCALGLIAATATAAPVSVHSLAREYASPTLGMAAKVGSTRIRISNMTFDLNGGLAAPVLIGGKPAGIFFEGQGHYSYHSTDLIETPALLSEAKVLGRHAQKGTDGSVTVDGNFERLYLLAAAVDLPPLAGDAESPALQQAFTAHREHFAKARHLSPWHLLIQQRLDSPAAPVAVAEIGGRDDDVYILDSVERSDERLLAMITDKATTRPELMGTMLPYEVAQQPVGRKRGAFVQPAVLLTAVDYTLVAGDNDSAKLSVTETLVPRGGAKRAARLNLLSSVFDTGNHLRHLHVDSVTDEAGHRLPYDFRHNSILVGLPAPVPVNTPVTLHFEISGDFLVRPHGDNFWMLGIEAWFPQPDLNGQFYTIHSVVKVKKPWIAFAPGDTVGRREEGDFNVVENRIAKPVQFAVVLGGKYDVDDQTYDGLTIHVATYAQKNERAMKQLSRLASKIVKFYEPWLGPFPFKELNIIEINDLGWGQAPPGTMFITREAFNPLLTAENRAYSHGVNHRFAHEIAHQYWGHNVKMGTLEEQWITESFADISSALVVKEIEGQRGYDELLNHWRGDARQVSSLAPIPLAHRIDIPGDPLESRRERTGLIYAKGACLLAALRQQAGDKNFFLLLRNLQGLYSWRFLTTKDVADLMQRIDGGKDYQAFFDRYYWGTEMPPQ